MPVQRCQSNGEPGWKWGKRGKCFTYDPSSSASEARAKAKAAAQGRAIAANKADAFRREVKATAWYMRQDAVRTKAICQVCGPVIFHADSAHLLRALNRDGRHKRAPEKPEPTALERRYRAQLKRRVQKTHKLMTAALKRELEKLAPEINERARKKDSGDMSVLRLDSQASDTSALLVVVTRIERAVRKTRAALGPAIAKLAGEISKFVGKGVTNQILTVLGLPVLPTVAAAEAEAVTAALLKKWAIDNEALIKSLDDRYFDDIREAVARTVGEGKSTASLSKELRERFNVSKSRADLIATDQVGTLNAQITKKRQTDLGIEEYIWSNSGDIRVRPLHRNPGSAGAAAGALGDTVRRWDTPHPTEGHPGEPIRCRCSALPVIPS